MFTGSRENNTAPCFCAFSKKKGRVDKSDLLDEREELKNYIFVQLG